MLSRAEVMSIIKTEVAAEKARQISSAASSADVAKSLRHDNAVKQRILASNPNIAYSMDVVEMSAAELAKHELKGYGIDCSNNSDPVEIRDAFHAGRHFERQGGRPSAAMDSGELSWVDKKFLGLVE